MELFKEAIYKKYISGIKNCSTMAEFEKFERLYYKVLFWRKNDKHLKHDCNWMQLTRADQATLEGTTGCLYPCTYLEYK